MKLAFIIDPIAKLDPAHDTSVALMEAACRKGYEVFIANMNTLSVKDGKAWAFLQSTKIYPIPLVNGKWQVSNPWYEVAASALDGVSARFVVSGLCRAGDLKTLLSTFGARRPLSLKLTLMQISPVSWGDLRRGVTVVFQLEVDGENILPCLVGHDLRALRERRTGRSVHRVRLSRQRDR